MNNSNNQTHIKYLRAAELQFQLAEVVRIAIKLKTQPLDVPIEWTHGKHRVRFEEIFLSKDQADFASWNQFRSATFLMAVAIKDAIVASVEDPKIHSDDNIRSAYQISRLIRNAFAHAPFDPIWSIDPDCRNKTFKVFDIVKLDTTGIDRQQFDWRNYGGPLALFRLSQFVRTEILKDTAETPKPDSFPKKLYQQGNLIITAKSDISPLRD